jgi:hypothetical protein
VCRWDIGTSAHSLVALTAAFLSGAAAGTFVMVRCALPHAHTRARARALMGGQAGRPAVRVQVMWAMMAQYKPVYTSALSAGMGLSGLIPAALALLQSHVREPPCCPRRPIAHSVRYRGFSGRRALAGAVGREQVPLSTRSYFLALDALLLLSAAAFAAIRRQASAPTSRRPVTPPMPRKAPTARKDRPRLPRSAQSRLHARRGAASPTRPGCADRYRPRRGAAGTHIASASSGGRPPPTPRILRASAAWARRRPRLGVRRDSATRTLSLRALTRSRTVGQSRRKSRCAGRRRRQ